MGRLLRGAMPQVRLHKASGQRYVRLAGKAVYVGRFGAPDANARCIELMIEHGYVASRGTGPRHSPAGTARPRAGEAARRRPAGAGWPSPTAECGNTF